MKTRFDDLVFVPHPNGCGGVRATVFFDNGYGASVIQSPYSYGGNRGLYELAVLGEGGKLVYDTPVTSDVEGNLTPADVSRLLAQIEALP